MKVIKSTLRFDRYCWEDFASEAPAEVGVLIVYSCDRKNSSYPIANVLFARAAENLAIGIQSAMSNACVAAEKKMNRRIYAAYATAENLADAIASASAIQYISKTIEGGMNRFRFFRYGNIDLTIDGKWAFRIPKSIKLNVNDCLKQLTKEDLVAFSKIAAESKANMFVRNTTDSSEDDAPHGGSWIEFWKAVMGKPAPACCPRAACHACGNSMDGAHVIIKGDPNKVVYVMPLCASCNRSRSTGWMKIDAGIKMIPVGEP